MAERTRWEMVAGALIVGMASLLVAGGSFFHRDDFVYAEYLSLNALQLETFTRSWFGHFVPGYIAFLAAFLKVFGLSWPAAVVIIALINVGAFVALTRILDAVLGRARFNVIAGLAFSLSVGPLVSRLWWAATLTNMLPLALALGALGCATRWVLRRRARHLVAALLLYVCALAFSEKNLLFSLHIAVWCVFVLWRGRPFRERVKEVLSTWMLWVGLAAVSLVEVVVFLTGGFVEESGSSPSARTAVAFIADSLLGGLIPSLFGVDMGKVDGSLLDPRILLAAAVFVAFVVWTVVKVRSNLGVWLFALIGCLANAVALSRRAEALGVTGGRNLRYLFESSALFWLAIGVVLVVTLREYLRRGETAPERQIRRPLRVGAATAAAVALLAVVTWSWSAALGSALAQSEGRTARAWIEALASTLPKPPPELIDSPLPEAVGLAPLHPYDMVAAALPSLGWQDVHTTNSLAGAWVVGPDGTAGPAAVADSELAFSGLACSDGTTEIAIPDARSPGRKFVILKYSGGSGDSVAFLLDNSWTVISRPESSGTVVAYIPQAFQGDLRVNTQGGTMCVESVRIGDIVPSTAAGAD
ncbi:MAG: hypothetical protein ACTHON_19075 [Humibacter sp.]